MRRTNSIILLVTLLSGVGCVPDPAPPGPTTTTTTSTTTEPTTTTTTTTTTSTTTTTIPPDIAITASVPASPSTSLSPRLVGFAPATTSTVRIFEGTSCSGAAVGAGTLADFTGAGILVPVTMGSTTSFTATASGPGFITACSAPFAFVNTLTPPNAFETEPNNGTLQADAITVDVGAPAEISAHLDGTGIGENDLFTFHVDAGRSIRIETFDVTGLTCDLIDTHIYLAPLDSGLGGNDDDGGVALCSLLAPGVGTYGANMTNVDGGDYLLDVVGSPASTAYRIRIEVLP